MHPPNHPLVTPNHFPLLAKEAHGRAEPIAEVVKETLFQVSVGCDLVRACTCVFVCA